MYPTGINSIIGVNKTNVLLDKYFKYVSDKSFRCKRNKILKQRAISIQKLRDAKNVGIIIEIKPGQRFGNPKYLVDELKKKGKNPVVITMNEVTPEKITNFYYIDAFVELACPRIAVDDFAKYSKPILTFREALVALDIKSWEDFLNQGAV